MVSEALKRLFRTYPSFLADDPHATMKVYFEAVSSYAVCDIEAAVTAFLAGSVPGHNPAFAPSAPQVGSAARRAMETRLEGEARRRKPALPPPDIPKDDDSRARVREVMATVGAALDSKVIDDTAAGKARASEWQRKMDDRFCPDMSEAAIAARLGFAVGDEDGDRDVA